MQNPYLLTHILSHIRTIARVYDHSLTLLETVSWSPDITDAPYGEMIPQDPLIRSYHPEGNLPMIFSVNESLVYAWVPAGDVFCLLGPSRITEAVAFHNRLRFCDEETGGAWKPWEDAIPYCSISVFAEDILLLYCIENHSPKGGRPLDSQQLLAANCTYQQVHYQIYEELYRTIFDNVENCFAHNPYNHEARENACVRCGDVEGLLRIQKERFPGRYGKLADDPVRQAIDLGIITITLASRAAIEGGLHFETSFYLSDIFVQRLEACHDVTTIEKLYYGAQMEYAKLVRELLTKKGRDMPEMENRHISHCKDYIFAHLHEKLTVQQIAKAVGLDANYLSTLFRKCEKVPLKQFILHEKIKLAQTMLAYSDRSYVQIAASLGFSSQSHMGAEFRKVTGMTPRAYRLAHSADDFVHESMSR